jgi:sugar phosphate isomerase/epimerase
MMKKHAVFAAVLMFCCLGEVRSMVIPADVYEGWHLGMQGWTMRDKTLFETIDQTAGLGLRWLEAFPGQRISPEIADGFGPDISKELREKVLEKLRQSGVQIKTFGVYSFPSEESGMRKTFEFAKAMGIEVILSEPSLDQFELLDRLCQEYRIRVAIHNHPQPTRYWNPDIVLAVCQDRSSWIGAAPDIGHWVRSGIDPVEWLQKLQGRIFDVHLKEIDEGKDLIWGQGQNRIGAALAQLHKQGYQGPLILEYENHWNEDYLPQLRRCIAFYTQEAARLASERWSSLFQDDLSNAVFNPGSWTLKDGVLSRTGKGDIWTQKKYKDFILDFDFKVEKDTNSGVFLRAAERTWLPWVEVQIMDSYGKPVDRRDTCGAIYDILAPQTNAVRPAGQWNRMTILAAGPVIRVFLNHQPMIEMDLRQWTTAHQNPDGSSNKFDVAYKDLPPEGYIGFQDHGFPVAFRNIKIRELN